MPSKVTFDMAKARFDAVHQGRITLVEFTNAQSTVAIGCPTHGNVAIKSWYSQFMARKSGCPKCARRPSESRIANLSKKAAMPLEVFKARFDALNQGAITLVSYTAASEPVEVLCPKHGTSRIARGLSALRMKVSCHACTAPLNPQLSARNETYEQAMAKFARQPAGHSIDLNDKTYSGTTPMYKMFCPIYGYRYEPLANMVKRGCSACVGGGVGRSAAKKFTPA